MVLDMHPVVLYTMMSPPRWYCGDAGRARLSLQHLANVVPKLDATLVADAGHSRPAVIEPSSSCTTRDANYSTCIAERRFLDLDGRRDGIWRIGIEHIISLD